MGARVPLDVDMEDRLVYGLTPLRLAYAVLAALAAMAVWSAGSLIPLIRAPIAVLLLAGGAGLAWGTVRGRPADAWLMDLAIFVWTTRRITWHGG